MPKPVVASYCTTFLKPEMLHIFRQITGLQEFDTFVIAKSRQCEDRFPMDDLELLPKAKSNFARRFWLKYIRREPPIVYRGEYRMLERILKARRADLIHVYFGHTGVHLLPFIEHWPGPAVVSFHGMDVQPRENQPGYVDKLKQLLKTVPLVLVRSESLRERLLALGCPADKIRINRTGIPFEKFPVAERGFPERGDWRIVQACRLIEKKGLDTALRAFAEFQGDYPGAEFTIAGEGPIENDLRAQAKGLGIAGSVRFAGFLSEEELRRLYHESHLFVHPSQLTADQNQEGIPNSMLEAMATGLPVVATLHGGIPEAVENGRTGLLTEERDVGGLLASLRALARDKQRWEVMGREAAESVREHFGQPAQIARLEGFYREAIERHGA